MKERTCSRRNFLKGMAVIGASILTREIKPVTVLAQEPTPILVNPDARIEVPPFSFFRPESRPKMSLQEILNNHSILENLTAVNTSCIPDNTPLYQGFHQKSGETIVHRVASTQGGESVDGYGQGIKEAVFNGKKVFLILELPEPPKKAGLSNKAYQRKYQEWQDNLSQWEKRIKERVEFFSGPSKKPLTFIIGNEINNGNKINNPDSYWGNNLPEYLKFYLSAYRIIKDSSPDSRVFPYQESYYGNGEVLVEFLGELKKVNGKIDGLAINIYDISSNIKERVLHYQMLLHSLGLNVPIVISELGKPMDYLPSEEEKAAFVIQHLATAASLIKEGLIEMAAWFCGFTSEANLVPFSLSSATKTEFRPFPAFFAFILSQRIFNGDKISLTRNPNGLVKVSIYKGKSAVAEIYWNEGRQAVSLFIPEGKIITPTGNLLKSKNIILANPANPKLSAGGTIIVLH